MPHPVTQQFLKDQFSHRFNVACENNPNVPPKFHGQQVFIQEKLADKGTSVSVESIRKWQNAVAIPSNDKVELLAEILSVDVSWLMMGEEVAVEAKQRRSYNLDKNAASNIVAGLIGMDRGNISKPLSGKQPNVHFNAVIKGINYPIHAVFGEIVEGNVHFKIPADSDGLVIIGLVKTKAFNFRVFEITDDAAQEFGAYSKGGTDVIAPIDQVKEIKSFAERL